MKGMGLWKEGFLEKYFLSFVWKRVGLMDNYSGDDGTDEFRYYEKKNDQDKVADGMRQEVYSKDREIHNEMKSLIECYSLCPEALQVYIVIKS